MKENVARSLCSSSWGLAVWARDMAREELFPGGLLPPEKLPDLLVSQFLCFLHVSCSSGSQPRPSASPAKLGRRTGGGRKYSARSQKDCFPIYTLEVHTSLWPSGP